MTFRRWRSSPRPDRLMAMGAVMFRSTGLHPDGKKFDRNGRSTCTFMRTAIGAPWVCTHSHLSRHARHAVDLARQADAEVVILIRVCLLRHCASLTTGVSRARDVRQARLPRPAQAGGRQHHVRQSRHHRIAADGRLRGRERHPLHPRPPGGGADGDGRRLCAGVRQAHGAQPACRARPRQRHGHALRRADGGLADPGDRRPAGHRISGRGADPLRRPADAGQAVREVLRAGRPAERPADPGASRGEDRAGAADRAGVPVAARRHPQERRRHRPAGADARGAARSRRHRRGERRRRPAGQGARAR